MYTCPIIFTFSHARVKWKRKKHADEEVSSFVFFIQAYIHIHSIEKTKRRRDSWFIHLLSRWILSTLYFLLLLLSFSVYFSRLAWWRRPRSRREYTYIHTQEHADSSLREQILERRRELSFEFFFVHIHTHTYTQTLISLMKMMWTNVSSVRFVHRMIWSIIHYSSTFVYLGTHWMQRKLSLFFLHCFDDLRCTHARNTHTCLHTRSDHCSMYFHHWTYVALVELYR